MLKIFCLLLINQPAATMLCFYIFVTDWNLCISVFNSEMKISKELFSKVLIEIDFYAKFYISSAISKQS